MQKFERLIEQNYPGLNFVAISNEAYMPGVILNDDDRIVDAMSHLFSGGNWKTKTVEANTGDQTIEGSFSLGFGGTFLGAVTVKSNVSSKY